MISERLSDRLSGVRPRLADGMQVAFSLIHPSWLGAIYSNVPRETLLQDCVAGDKSNDFLRVANELPVRAYGPRETLDKLLNRLCFLCGKFLPFCVEIFRGVQLISLRVWAIARGGVPARKNGQKTRTGNDMVFLRRVLYLKLEIAHGYFHTGKKR